MKWLFGLLTVLVLLVVVVAMKQLPIFIRSGIDDYMAKKFPNVAYEIGAINSSVFNPGSVVLRDISFKSSKTGIPELEATIQALSISLDILPLMRKEIKISRVRIEKPFVTFRDGDSKGEAREKSSKKKSTLPFEMRGAELVDGEFKYIRITHGTKATLNLHDISIAVLAFGGTNDLIDATAKFRIEKTGSVALNVRVPILSSPTQVDVDIKIADQNLADTTPFFKENAGVELKGTMVEGHGVVNAKGSSLTATVVAKYKDFDLKIQELYDRTPTAKFFMNLGTSISMNEKNLSRDLADQKRSVTTQREPGEPWVGFILRGLKEAAIKVSMAK